MEIIIKIMTSFGFFLMEASPFMLLGLFFAGLLKAFLPDDFVKKHIGAHKKWGILKASAFGIPLPLCSCGVVPAAAGIRKQGAGKGSVVSFLVSTPETGVDSMAITYALLGPVMAVIRPLASFATALFSGLVVDFFDKPEEERDTDSDDCFLDKCTDSCCSSNTENEKFFRMAESCDCEINKESKALKFKKGMNFAFIELVGDIAGWFLAGILLAAIIAVFVTPEAVNAISSENPLLIMLLMLLVSVPLYVCATSSTPVAAAFLMTGISPGAALVFLLAGPATNAASLSVINSIIGKRATIIYLAGIIIFSMAAGLATDYLFSLTGYKLHVSAGDFEDGISFVVQVISALILGLVFIYPFYKKAEDFFSGKKEAHDH
ncbi:MAG: hypothetical protein CSB21_00575 [Deltaproteobacteria bacterium]|nr:MAG: hypothetical protein CSB21_00575 [Deltaproteobacteria bacterium]